jgi:hypothetical protein
VISDGVRDIANVMSFQKMKGLNDLTENDINIVATHLAPAKYAELNVLGRWLEIGGDVIRLHYEDQINQAVGRNRGFRQSDKPTKTAVICSNRLWKIALSNLNQSGTSRTLLYEELEKQW